MKVITVDGYPEAPLRGTLVDVHFIQVGFTERVAGVTATEFYRLIEESADGEFGTVTMDRLRQGPSYIELGAWLGSQELALCFLALGEHLGCWTVVTPATLGITGEDADRMAGAGFVMNGGVRPLDEVTT